MYPQRPVGKGWALCGCVFGELACCGCEFSGRSAETGWCCEGYNERVLKDVKKDDAACGDVVCVSVHKCVVST